MHRHGTCPREQQELSISSEFPESEFSQGVVISTSLPTEPTYLAVPVEFVGLLECQHTTITCICLSVSTKDKRITRVLSCFLSFLFRFRRDAYKSFLSLSVLHRTSTTAWPRWHKHAAHVAPYCIYMGRAGGVVRLNPGRDAAIVIFSSCFVLALLWVMLCFGLIDREYHMNVKISKNRNRRYISITLSVPLHIAISISILFCLLY